MCMLLILKWSVTNIFEFNMNLILSPNCTARWQLHFLMPATHIQFVQHSQPVPGCLAKYVWLLGRTTLEWMTFKTMSSVKLQVFNTLMKTSVPQCHIWISLIRCYGLCVPLMSCGQEQIKFDNEIYYSTCQLWGLQKPLMGFKMLTV